MINMHNVSIILNIDRSILKIKFTFFYFSNYMCMIYEKNTLIFKSEKKKKNSVDALALCR